MKWCAIVVGVLLLMSPVRAEGEALDVQTALSLLKRNSIEGKVIDATVSITIEAKRDGGMIFHKQDSRLVFDAKTKRYREERYLYDNPVDPDYDEYSLIVSMWNGNEHIEWDRAILKEPGFRALGQGIYENPGVATIERSGRKTPAFVEFYYHHRYYDARLFTEHIPEENPKASLAGNTITLDSDWNKFEFAKETSALERITSYAQYADDKERRVVETWEFSNHVERSGIWIPLKIVRIIYSNDWFTKSEEIVDPETLRLLDAVEDEAIFKAALPIGCFVEDKIRNRNYTVKTVGMVFMEAWEWVLEMARTGALRAAGQGDEW